jgi:MFS family permease
MAPTPAWWRAADANALILVIMQVGMWSGYVWFGVVSDRIGRKRTYVTDLVMASAADCIRIHAPAGAAARTRTVSRILCHRILQRLRRVASGSPS